MVRRAGVVWSTCHWRASTVDGQPGRDVAFYESQVSLVGRFCCWNLHSLLHSHEIDCTGYEEAEERIET